MPGLSSLNPRYDVVVIGGGVHGAAAALEATRLGYDVLLVERGDFCSSTSANSLKIIHGGLRYLQSLNFLRSRESAREQSRLLDCAPHLVKPLTCLMGTNRSLTRGRFTMALGMWFYDNIIRAGMPNRRLGRVLSVAEARRLVGGNMFEQCTGVALWHDAQVIDSERLVLTYLKTAERAGAHVLNYTAAVNVVPGRENAVKIQDAATGDQRTVSANTVIDTGSLMDPHRHWTRAVNLVLNRSFPDCALGLKLDAGNQDSGRLFFATPLADKTIVGTWYFPDRVDLPAKLRQSELHRCLSDVQTLLPDMTVEEKDVSCIHLGRLPVADESDPLSLLERPVVRPLANSSRVICVTGVKYTTAAATANKALRLAGLSGKGRPRATTPWYGAAETPDRTERIVGDCFERRSGSADGPVIRRLCRQYGSVAAAVAETARRLPHGFDQIPECDAIRAEIHYCIEQEYCRTLTDFVARRSGIGSLAIPPDSAIDFCAAAMAGCFGWDRARVAAEIDALKSHYQRVEGSHSGGQSSRANGLL